MFSHYFDQVDSWFALLANVLTAFGILGLFLWWINRRAVKIYIRVPKFPDINYNMLYIRDGGEGSEIINKIHSFKKLNSKNNNEDLLYIRVICKPHLGFQFKCFAQLSGNEKQKKEAYPEFKKKLKYLGFHSISKLAYDGKVWFLLPEEYLFGQIRASVVENIINNIWYPTLAKIIYPYHSIIAKVPLCHEDYNFFDHAEYYLAVYHQNGTRDELFFGTLEKNEHENYAKIKASVKIQPGFKPFKFRGIVKLINGNHETKNVFKALKNSTVNYAGITSEKIKNIGEEFMGFLDNDNYIKQDLEKNKAVDTASNLAGLLRKNKSKMEGLVEEKDLDILEQSLDNFVSRNKTDKTFSECAAEMKSIIASLDFKYDIKVLKILDDSTIEIEFEDVYGFKKEGNFYVWDPEILK